MLNTFNTLIHGNTTWTDERVAALLEHIEAGLTASQIGAELGCTRNAVIAKTHRMGVRLKGIAGQNMKGVRRVRREQPTRKTPFRMPVATPPRQANTEPARALAPDARFRCTILDLTNEMCRWPVTDDMPHMFCGTPSADLAAGIPYCPCHMREAGR